MPVVNVALWKGNTTDQRRQLVTELTDSVARIANCPEEAVTVIVTEVETDHWGKGGRLASEL
ncbi:tautomerase family protein [Streptomyces monashensis]|uniref:Tautomerase n=1 Tax=Streptomyces monashensis TaxID=1678012 RepID=A0A1S2PFD2_9ACTN|nr:2-hydroxymuconate tautomerase family protein [Streptomyces monashensis]OIJ92316.1 4-oxalocrotonate tautomerase family enzyme [Streptomyces monashensis]